MTQDSDQSSDSLNFDRRQYIRSLVTVSPGLSILSGCMDFSPGFESDKAVSKLGSLPQHNINLRKRKVGKPKNGKSQALEPEDLMASTGSSERDNSYELQAAVDGKDINKAGKVCASSAVSRDTFWKAPDSSDYQIKANYNGSGGFFGLLHCPEISDDSVLTFSMTNLSVLEQKGQEVVSVQKIHLRHGDDGEGSLTKKLIKELVSFIVQRILSRWFGQLAGLIADKIADALVEYGEAIFDIITGQCYDVYFDGQYDNEFEVSPTESGSLQVQFSANRGHTYKIQFSPVVGSTLKSKTYTTRSEVIMKSQYELDSYSISRI